MNAPRRQRAKQFVKFTCENCEQPQVHHTPSHRTFLFCWKCRAVHDVEEHERFVEDLFT